ncbi:radical SAM protein [Sabulicella glaciei]|uniref:Radical SAM protein n=1 Tax=Sabulicella glaciei TaxID=2984948 RepID=A0ABT3P063_9PROT|nr:radical SAM protein [Roseococcus sp. MDT2-1-1]MCW8087740.1 radical SAM protein [Roseococcus sp. MDT2-1-1]
MTRIITIDHRSGPALRRLTDAMRESARAATRSMPALKRSLRQIEQGVGLVEHSIGQMVPSVIQPRPRRITVAVTANCNLRCTGCRYGRDFMPGHQLSLNEVRNLLDDAKAGGVELVRLYGGEPLLHKQLPEMVQHSVGLGLATYVTTNGTLLRQKIDALFEAGLRNITIGFYGTGEGYDSYVNRKASFARLEEGLTYARARYGSALSLQLNYLIMRPTCTVEALRTAWDFAERFDMSFHTDLVHYSLPYFTDGQQGGLHFTQEQEPEIRRVVAELSRLKQANPLRVRESLASIHSIPDWLLKGPDMRVPCDVSNLIWVGADGSVQLCYVTFKLGNIRESPLRDMLFTPTHRQAARDAFQLNCPNCHCERDSRIQKHLPSRLRYASLPKESA